MMKIPSTAGLLTGIALVLAAIPASARVNVDLNVVVPGTYYVQPPVYVQPSPVYVYPAPAYVPPPVYVQPAPVYVRPQPTWGYRQDWRERHEHDRHQWRDQDRDGIPDRRDRDRDGDGVPNQWDQRPGNPYRY